MRYEGVAMSTPKKTDTELEDAIATQTKGKAQESESE